MANRRCRLTTTDNPFDPFDDFSHWYDFDMDHKYDCSGYVDRIARTSDEFSDEENNRIVEEAIDEIIKFDFRNIFVKVVKEDVVSSA